MHAHEIDIDEKLVRGLLHSQFPQWAEFSLKRIQSDGTEHAIYRLGVDMCVRLPLIPEVDPKIEKEQQWLPYLAPHVPLAIPVPLGKGIPGEDYPLHWSVYSWLEGENATLEPITDLKQAAIDLARFLKSLQKIPVVGGPLSARSGPLITQDSDVRSAIEALGNMVDTKRVTKLWDESLDAPLWDKEPVWIHGDLLPANLLIHQGHLNAIIDFGILGVGDPACDLIPAWSLFTNETRDVFRTALGVDDATWLRGRGWALSIGLIILPYYQYTNQGLFTIGKRMINEILTEDSDF